MKLNCKGMSLVGVLISVSIGLIVMVGILKGLGSLKQKAEIVTKATTPAFSRQIVAEMLRDDTIWEKSLEKSGGRVPGKEAPVTLYYKNGSGPWACQLRGGGRNRGVVITSKLGQPQTLNCSRCRGDLYCGFDKSKFSRIELTVTPNDNLRPAYTADIFDTAVSKKKSSFTVDSTGEELYEEKQVSCPNNQFLIKVVEGKPICENQNVAIVNTNWCNNRTFLTGFTGDGRPICTEVLKYGQDMINTNNARILRNITRLDRKIVDLRRYSTNVFEKLGRVHNYQKVSGTNDEECASLKRMTCRDGYMMHAYEQLNDSSGSNKCSLQCRKISPY